MDFYLGTCDYGAAASAAEAVSSLTSTEGFSSCGSAASTNHFFVPRGTQDLGAVRQHPRHASVRIVCVVSAAHDVPQVGLLCGSATSESGLMWVRNTREWPYVGPQHQILVDGHTGCLFSGATFISPQGVCH